MTEVRELIYFLGSCEPERLPPQTVASAKSCLLDWFGVALAASQRRAFTDPVLAVVEGERVRGASVEVCTRDGARRRVVPDRAAGIRRLARRHEFVDEKVAALVPPVLSPQRALELRETVRSIEDLADVSGTIQAFGAAGAAAREPVAADAAPAESARRHGARRGGRGGRSCSAR